MCQGLSSQEDKTMLSVSSRGDWIQRMRRDWKSKREREAGAKRIATEGVRGRDWESACAPESNPLNPHLQLSLEILPPSELQTRGETATTACPFRPDGDHRPLPAMSAAVGPRAETSLFLLLSDLLTTLSQDRPEQDASWEAHVGHVVCRLWRDEYGARRGR